jgi:ferric-dicitrate binding protein FerR (iron transport regulator)
VGELRIVRGDGSTSATAEIVVGSAIETSASGWAALRLAGGASVRVDGGSHLHVESPSRILLEAGAVYVDSGPGSGAGRGLDIATAAGLFREVGTQYEVRILSSDAGGGSAAATRLRVREGRVELRREAGRRETMTAAAGEQLAVDAGGEVSRASVAAFGPEWNWVRASAPPMAIEGVVARRFLEWLAREEGLRLDLADESAAEIAGRVVLHGSIAELPIDDAPAAVLASCGLAVAREGERLVVRVRTAS